MSLVLSRLDYVSATVDGLLANFTDRLQSMLNATSLLVYSRWSYDHVTLLLRELHWLEMRQRIEYKLAVLVYRCLNGLALSYLANDLQCMADLNSLHRLRLSSTFTLVVPSTCLPTVGDRAFPVAVARVWNTLPAEVTSLPSLPAFKRQLKTLLFEQSFPSSSGRL